MRRTSDAPIVIADTRGGRNGTDPPLSLRADQVVEAVNIDWRDTTFARKRGGSASVSLSGGTAFSSGVQTLIRHVPGNDETAAELWGVDGAPIVKRLTGGTSWANVTLADAISTKPQDVVGASLNGKLFLAYDSTVDRLHAYDPNLSSPQVRRVGINPGTTAPSAANTAGAGAYAAVLRYYRVRFEQIVGSTRTRRSEATPSQSFTPSGVNTGVTITCPTAPGEGETHWSIEASTDNATWCVLFGEGGAAASIAIATATATDSYATSLYPTLPQADNSGFYTLFPSVRYLLTDGNRLIGGGAWESSGTISGGKNSRIWFTPVLGSADKSDDERVPNQTTQKNWVDLNENDGGALTGLGGPINGVPWAFKQRQVWKLRPTGDVSAPYLPRKVRDDIGCVAHKTIAVGEDHLGRPALYFLSHRGPYRVTADGDVEYLGRDNEDLWRTLNLGASTVVGCSVYYPPLHQWWLWIATGSNNDPDTRMVFDVQLGVPDGNGQIRGGWAKHTGDAAGARCAVLFSNTLGASMSRDLKPYLGRSTGTTVLKGDTSDTDDAGTAFRGYVTTRPLNTMREGLQKIGVGEPILTAKAQSATTISVSIERDYGLETRTGTVSLAPSASETRISRKVEGLELGEADTVQITVGDASAVASAWSLDALVVPLTGQERR